MYGYWDEDGYWEFWSTNANLIGQYSTWAEVLKDFPELVSEEEA